MTRSDWEVLRERHIAVVWAIKEGAQGDALLQILVEEYLKQSADAKYLDSSYDKAEILGALITKCYQVMNPEGWIKEVEYDVQRSGN